MKAPNECPTVRLTGIDGNAFSILSEVVKALRLAGADKEYVEHYIDRATAGDYNHLLGTTMEFVNVV